MNVYFNVIILFMVLSLFSKHSQANELPKVVLISIDALGSKYIKKADKYNLKIPNIKKIVLEGSYSLEVRGYIPTLTYPAHSTLITGHPPSAHGIIGNNPFNLNNDRVGDWYSFKELKKPTLFELAQNLGRKVANVQWPVTDNMNISWNIGSFEHDFRTGHGEDLRRISTPYLIDEIEEYIESEIFLGDCYEADKRRSAAALYLIEKKKPDFLALYLSSFDHDMHKKGSEHSDVFKRLEDLDRIVGEIYHKAIEVMGNNLIFSVISDHGMSDVAKGLNLNVAFKEDDLLKVDDHGNVVSYKVYAWHRGGNVFNCLERSR